MPMTTLKGDERRIMEYETAARPKMKYSFAFERMKYNDYVLFYFRLNYLYSSRWPQIEELKHPPPLSLSINHSFYPRPSLSPCLVSLCSLSQYRSIYVNDIHVFELHGSIF